MEFKEFKKLLQKNAAKLFDHHNLLFTADVDKDKMWEIYLDSFPPGTNEIFRERREYDCSCCRHFIKSFGHVVVINGLEVRTIWDFQTNDSTFQPVIDALNAYVKSVPIRDVFVTNEHAFGTDMNYDDKAGNVITWDHFYVDLPSQFVNKSIRTVDSIIGGFRDVKNVFKRSLDEITKDAIEIVLDLISQNSLYKGEEWKGPLEKFLSLHTIYHGLADDVKDIFCWSESTNIGGAIGKIKNHSIGVLLSDLSCGADLDAALRKYESIVAPFNYKRPKAVFTKKMIEEAQKTLSELGLINSLERRFATVDDITINNILFANRDTLKQMAGDVFDELKREAKGSNKQFDRVEEVPIDRFIEDILPRTTGIEVLLENRHVPNLVSVIAPTCKDAKPILKWPNNFSWAYNGNITDSMKERVKAAGGNVEGVLRFSIQWNENGDNHNDFDAHCTEPNKNEIYFGAKMSRYTKGRLDVDIIHPAKDDVAVENITWANTATMQDGIYDFGVHVFSYRGGSSGFRAEIEFDGHIYSYDYNKDVKPNDRIRVARVEFSKTNGFKLIESMQSTESSINVWDLNTNEFHPVSVCMFSPNYWDNQQGIGHRHYFFILKNCINDTSPNGFFNEFLNESLMTHKRVFEALGAKMKVAPSDQQLSGLGFSTTKRNSLVCKLTGYITRTVRIVF